MIATVISLVLATMRLTGEKGEIFQAVAHLFVGCLGGAWLVGRKRVYLAVAVVLSAVELICFLRDHGYLSFPAL